ncbi:MAG: hypothetical protein ASARMPRED_007849 [Alectoria sarmentosa]|nr:MAG: hypothetical protein ASARMPRED_007849 [Alectoria sarmentosa]
MLNSRKSRECAHIELHTSSHVSCVAFQQYVTVKSYRVAVLSKSVSLEDASVIPLAFATAAAGLYAKETLNLPFPTLGVPSHHSETSVKPTLLIWGESQTGSSSVGAMAIQLAVASGFSVATTCSPRNFEFVKFLGAKWAVDYSDAEAVKKDLSSILEANSLVGGFDAAGFGDSTSKCAIALGSICDQTKKSDTKDLLLCTVLPFQLKDLPAGVRQAGWASSGGIFGDIDPGNEHFLRIRQAVWGEFVPKGLASGAFKPAPPVLRGGNGLEEVQKAMDRWGQGVSAQKITVKVSDDQ